MIQTYQDCMENLIDFIGGGLADTVTRNCRQAIQEAYRDVPRAHKWAYLYRHGRIFTETPYNGSDPAGVNPNATLSYQHSGGAVPRLVTLTGGVWPSWAFGGYLRIADTQTGTFNFVAYRVSQVLSSTTLTLDPEVNPGEDIPSGTGFILYQDTYLLPCDFIAADQALYELNIGGMTYVHPRDWLYENRYSLASGTPVFYSITGDRQYPGKLVMRLCPWPSDTRTIDFIYQRSPRPLLIQQATGGTISIAAQSGVVTGIGTSFSALMVGSVIRISANNKTPSSANGGIAGFNPPALEATITGWVSPTSIVVDTPSPSTLTGVGYYVSDPIDMEQGAMLNAFLRAEEKSLAKIRNMKNYAQIEQSYRSALDEARAAASTSFAGRAAGPKTVIRRRLRDMGYVGPDQS